MRQIIGLLLMFVITSAPASDCAISELMKPIGPDRQMQSADCSLAQDAALLLNFESMETQPDCDLGTVNDIEPADAIKERISGREAWIFAETLMHSWEATNVETLDAVLLMSGPDVWGGNVVFLVAGECVLGYKFVTLLELIHAKKIVHLFATEPTLTGRNHLDESALAELASAGNAVAEFHAGLVAAWGRGGKHDRPASLDWLQQAAEKGYAPAMLALGMALSGPEVIHDGVEFVGEPPPTDAFTALVKSCYWLFVAGDAPDPVVADAGRMYFGMNWEKMSSDEQAACKILLQSG